MEGWTENVEEEIEPPLLAGEISDVEGQVGF